MRFMIVCGVGVFIINRTIVAIIYLRKQDMTNNVDKAVDNSDLGENGFVVTDEMIEDLYQALSVIDDRRTAATQHLVKNIISVVERHASFQKL